MAMLLTLLPTLRVVAEAEECCQCKGLRYAARLQILPCVPQMRCQFVADLACSCGPRVAYNVLWVTTKLQRKDVLQLKTW